MKKLFSIITALLFVLTLSACSEDLQPKVTDLETKITDLEASIDGLEAAKKALEDEKAALVTEKNNLTSDLKTANDELDEKKAELLVLNGQKDTLQTEKAALEAQITTLTAEKTALETEKATLTAEKTTLEAQITELNAEIAALEAILEFDNIITISVVEAEGTLSKYVGYNNDFEGTLFDLLDENFTVVATDSQYGHMINELESLKPLNGAYISFNVNGTPSMVGVDSAELAHGNTYSFELLWWDMTEQKVNQGIELYLEHYAADAVNATSIDYTVAAALAHLGVLEDYVTDEEVQAYVDGLTLSTWNDYVKAIVILEAADLDATSLYTALNGIAAPAGFASTGYQLNIFSANNTTVDFSTFETAALTDLSTDGKTPVDLGIDSGAPGVIALSNYKTTDGVDALINDWVSFIKTNQTEDGKVLDKDFGWGQSESAATMAQAIMGLVANDVNPKGGDTTGTDMTKLNYNLLDGMTSMATETGAYLGWDGNPDLGFSTPQAFLALVTYQVYSNNGNEPVNPFSFE